MFSSYLVDYFEKESTFIRTQFSELLRNTVDDVSILSKPASMGILQSIPLLRGDRIKSVLSIVQTIGNKVFINRVISITSESVTRMENIARDDKKLTSRLKDLYLLQMSFFAEGLFQPWTKCCVAALLKMLGTKVVSSTSAPPTEVLAVISIITYGVSQIKSNFEEVFQRPLSIVPNIVAVCKENRLKVFKDLDIAVRQIFYAWTLCCTNHLERLLSSLQSRYDYAPKFESATANGKLEPTVACDTVCKALQEIVNTVKTYENKFIGLDVVKIFWRPLGQQFTGLILSHFRKQKISMDGAKYVIRDVKEYTKVIN